MDKTRTRTSDEKCPRCGEPIIYYESGVMVDQEPEPVRWDVYKRRCSAGCLLTVEDFPRA